MVGPFGLFQPLADGLKLFGKETVIPAGANRVVFVFAPMLTFLLSLIAWAVIPFDAGMVLANINVGVLYLFAISSLGSTASSWPAGRQLEIRLPRRTPLGGADGVIRSVDRLRDHHGAALRRVAEPDRRGDGAEDGVVRDPAAADVRRVLHFGACRDEPGTVRPAGRRVGAGRRVQRRIFGDDLRPVLPGRIREHDPHERDDVDPVPGRLAASLDIPPLNWIQDRSGSR